MSFGKWIGVGFSIVFLTCSSGWARDDKELLGEPQGANLLKGVLRWGDSTTRVWELLPRNTNCTPDKEYENQKSCFAAEGIQLGSVERHPTNLIFVDGKFASFSAIFPASLYDQIVTTFTKRLGTAPKVTQGTARNLMGAKLANRTARWKTTNTEITAFERAGKMNEGFLIVSHRDLSTAARKKTEANTQYAPF